MDKDQYKVLTERIQHLQSSVDDTNRDLGHDREDLQKFALRLGAVEHGLDEVWKIVNNFPKKTSQSVTDAIKPIVQEAKNLTDAIEHKKTISLQIIKRPWWKLW